MTPGTLSPRQFAVLAYMTGRGYVTVASVSAHLRVDSTTAKNTLTQLAAKGYAEASDTALPTARGWLATEAGEAALAAEMDRDA